MLSLQPVSAQKKSRNRVNTPYPKRKFIGYFLVFLTLLVITILSASLPIYLQYEKSLENQLIMQERTSVVAAKQMIQKELYEQLHIFDLLVKSKNLNNYLAEDTPAHRSRLEDLLINISSSFHRFDQIRLLNNNGKEVIRVNLEEGEGVLVAASELQNKAKRPYFKATQQMQTNQIHVSPMDLNIEQEKIELPYKPTLRISTRLYNEQGEPVGVFVINYLAKGMLKRFRYLMTQRIDQQGMLIDSQGYWLSNHQRSNEWGADLGKPQNNFAKLYPEAWQVISTQDSGTLKLDNGIFRYQSIEPLNFIDNQPAHFRMEHHPLLSEESYANTNWKLVIFIPRELIKSHSFLYQPLGRNLLILFMLLIPGLAFMGASYVVQLKTRQHKDQQVRKILKEQASIDALTGINNRRNFYELGELALKQAHRQQLPLAALMLDADNFKKVNDSYGHAVGDLVLKALAKTVTQALRDVDIFGRVGGEEFAVLLPHTPLDKALEVAERLRVRLEELKIPLAEGKTINFTVSIGLAMLTPEEQQLDKLYQKADLALYKAKELGRNRVINYTEVEGSHASHK